MNEYTSQHQVKIMCIYVGHCDVTFGQGDIPLYLFFPDFWQKGNFALSRTLLIRLQRSQIQLSLAFSLTQICTLLLPLSEKDRAGCQEVLWPFPK